MNSWYTMASIQILDMENLSMFYSHVRSIALNVKTDCIIHGKRLMCNSSTQAKTCQLDMNFSFSEAVSFPLVDNQKNFISISAV